MYSLHHFHVGHFLQHHAHTSCHIHLKVKNSMWKLHSLCQEYQESPLIIHLSSKTNPVTCESDQCRQIKSCCQLPFCSSVLKLSPQRRDGHSYKISTTQFPSQFPMQPFLLQLRSVQSSFSLKLLHPTSSLCVLSTTAHTCHSNNNHLHHQVLLFSQIKSILHYPAHDLFRYARKASFLLTEIRKTR